MKILYGLKQFIFVFLLLTSSIAVAQNNNYLFLRYGLQAQAKGMHYEACSYFVNAAKVDPTNIDVNYHYALSLNEINEYRMAEYYFQRTFDLDTEGKYPDAMVGLALTQKSNGKYKESLGNWEIILEYAELTRNKELITRAQIEIATCTDILALNYPYYENIIRNLSEINSEGADFSGVYYDTTTIYYSNIDGLKAVPTKSEKRAPRVGQIVVAEKYNGRWEYGRKIPGSINIGGINNVDFSINPQRNKYYFVRCEEDSVCGIYTGGMERGFPSRPAPVKTINEAGGLNTMPCAAIVNDKPVLIFASDREGGYGGLDLWYAFITGVGTTEEPVNLGPLVNTPGDDVTPFVDSREKVLYFSSDWHPGFGGFDVFRCEFESLDTLDKPVNIGFPFNSSANDTYFTLAPERTKGLITSNRIGSSSSMSETCCNDLYEFTFPPEAGVNPKKKELEKEEAGFDPAVIDKYAHLSKKLPIILYFHNDEPNPKSKTTKTALTYRDCYVSYIGKQPEYKHQNVEDEQKIFGGLVEPGYVQLQSFLKELFDVAESGLELELEIRGYASPLAKDNYNTNLTQRRISSFINYLTTIREGAFKPYVQTPKNPTGNLKILLSPLGESTAQKGISDDPNQPMQSIFSLAAAKERRIEITRLNLPIISGSIRGNSTVYGAEFGVEEEAEAVQPKQKPTTTAKQTPVKSKPVVEDFNDEPTATAVTTEPKVLKNGVFDMGSVTEGDILKGTYTYTNTTNETIRFYKAEAECGCTGVKLSKTSIAPGESTEVYISFDSKDKSGVNSKRVFLFIQDIAEPITIEFLATVL